MPLLNRDNNLPPRERALVVWNPVAGRNGEADRDRQVELLATRLRAGGWEVAVATTDPATGARAVTAQALQQNYSVLIGCGGDGTLGQMADAIAHSNLELEQRPALAAAPPWGTANILANALGYPDDPVAAAEMLLAGKREQRPLGVANVSGRIYHFVTVASVGLDAEVVHRMEPEDKRRWGKLAYVAGALREAQRYFPAEFEFELSGARASADGLIIGLTPYYGGRMSLGMVEPGQIIMLALRGSQQLLALQALGLVTLGLERAPGVERLPPGTLRIVTPGRPIEVDGEAAGHTPVEFDTVPGGITVLR